MLSSGQLVVVRNLNKFFRGINKQRLVLGLALFFSTIIQVAMLVPKNRLPGNWIMQSIKLLSIRYWRIFFFRAAAIHNTGEADDSRRAVGRQPCQRECMINARSALDFGASTPAGRNAGR